jgi:hypothetical protein
MAGCTDDTFDKFQNNKDGDMAFEVTAPDNWTEGSARASRPASVAISRLESDYGRQLYLISEVSASPDSVVALPASRGSVVTGDAFHPSFGLSAICYTGTWTDTDEWLGKWTTNFAHDVKMAKSGQYWQAASPSEDLDWTGSGRVRFFAYAPYHGDIAAGSLSHCAEGTTGIPTVAFEATTDVKKQVDLLSTYADCDAAKGGTVQLVFKHALTAITIKTGEGMLAGKVTEVKFTGIGTKGTHEIGTGRWTGVSSPKDFTVTLDKTLEENGSANTAPGQEIVGGDLTFLMVPQTLGSDAKLIIKYTDKLSGVDRTLTASLSGTEWKAGTRVAYSVNTSGIKVVPEVDFSFECVLPTKSTAEGDTKIERGMEVPTSGYIPNFRVKSRAEVYQLDGSNHTASKTIDLPFTVEYSLDGGEWTDGGWKQHTEADKDHYATGCVLLKPRDVFVQMRGSMYTNPANGTAESHYDLSKGGETANCYMINAPGYYSLPLVYGNARNNPEAKLFLQQILFDDSGGVLHTAGAAPQHNTCIQPLQLAAVDGFIFIQKLLCHGRKRIVAGKLAVRRVQIPVGNLQADQICHCRNRPAGTHHAHAAPEAFSCAERIFFIYIIKVSICACNGLRTVIALLKIFHYLVVSVCHVKDLLCLFGGKTFLSAKKGKAVFCRLSPMCQFIRGYLPALSGKISFLQLYFCDKSLWYKLCRLWIPRS